MKITSAKFTRSVTGTNDILGNAFPKIVIMGRSNVGKSSLINSLTGKKGLAKTSSFPGRTEKINLFLINDKLYLVDLPGYGYAKVSKEGRERLEKLLYWYLFDSEYEHKKILLIIDANVGVTDADLATLRALEERGKHVIIIANKVDKIKKSEYEKKLATLKALVGDHTIIPYSSNKKIGITELTNEILG